MDSNRRCLILSDSIGVATYLYKVINYYNRFLLECEKIFVANETELQDYEIQAIISFIKFQKPCKINQYGQEINFLNLDSITGYEDELLDIKDIKELIEYLKKYKV